MRAGISICVRVAALALALVLVPLFVPTAAGAADPAEQELAARYAPVVRIVRQDAECGPGEPYRPSDVDAFLGNDSVALRGPWTTDDLVKIAPTAKDLSRGLAEYHLDFPGSPLSPGCDYERWAEEQTAGTEPTVYAHVLTEEGHDDRLALQYWFFYPFNDFNNKHESDWEMIQLEFAVPDAAAALKQSPEVIGYSQHEGVEQAQWGDSKLELVGGTHPVVHVAAGSHANYFSPALYLGRSGQQGFGCDDTREPTADLQTRVAVIPSDPDQAKTDYPWIGYEGHWGQREQSFYNGPTGPSQKDQWRTPFSWSQAEGRDHSYAVPAAGLFGTRTTSFFCGGVTAGSNLLRSLTANPGPTGLVLGLLAVVVVWLVRRTTWRPSAPLRLNRRRAWGQIVVSGLRMYAGRPLLFVGIGLLTVPVSAAVTALQALVAGVSVEPDVAQAPDATSIWGEVAGLAGLALAGVATVTIQAATVRAVVEIDANRPVTVWRAFALAVTRWRQLVLTYAVWLALVGLSAVTLVLIPVTLVALVLWILYVPIVELEGRSGWSALRRSASLVRRQFLKIALLIAATTGLAYAIGPLLGTAVILATNAPFTVGNLIAGLVYAVLLPLVSVNTTYAYFDTIVRERLRGDATGDSILPEEVSL